MLSKERRQNIRQEIIDAIADKTLLGGDESVDESLVEVSLFELRDLIGRLAQYESQCIPRTADMPEWAVGWGRDAEDNCVWMRNRTELDSDVPGLPEIVVARMRSQAGEEDMPIPAPDLLPDEPGPVYRHIVTLED